MVTPTTFDNGLRLLVHPMDGTKSVTVLILVGAGSRYETKDINGISHFLEHMFFKGAEKYTTTKAVSEAIDSVGGEFNAFTGKEYAGYYVKVAAEHVDVALDVLTDMMLHAKFPQEEIEKERGVIMEEYNMYQDTPMYQVGWNFEELMYGNQPIGWDQVGTKELINGVNHEDFVKYKEQLYTPDNTVIAVVGNVDAADIEAKIGEMYKEHSGSKGYDFDPVKRELMTERVFLKNKKTEQAHLVLGCEAYPDDHADKYVAKVLAALLGGNMSSRMFLNVRDAKGLCYYIGTSTDNFVDTGLMYTRAGVTVDKIDEAITSILHEYDMLLQHGFEEQELTKSKEYLKGRIVLGLEDSEEMAHLLAKQALLRGEVKSVDEVLAAIDAVTGDDVMRVAKELLQKDRYRLAVIGPYEDRAHFESFIN